MMPTSSAEYMDAPFGSQHFRTEEELTAAQASTSPTVGPSILGAEQSA